MEETETTGFDLVIGRDAVAEPGQSYAAGDVVDIYPLLEAVDEFEAEHNAFVAGGERFGARASLVRAAAKKLEAEKDRLRVDRLRTCNCSGRGRNTPLVKVYAHPDGRLWVWVSGYRIPNEAKGSPADELHEADKAWPLGSSGGCFTYCQFCRRYQAVLISGSGYRLVKCGRPRFGVVLA